MNNNLSIKNLNVTFVSNESIFLNEKKYFHVLKNISFDLKKGETLGIVGESGSGKTTLARAIMMLLKYCSSNAIINGKINLTLDDSTYSLLEISKKKLTSLRRHFQMIFQDPFSTLNPRLTIYSTLKEPLDIHKKDLNEKAKIEFMESLIEMVGLNKNQLMNYPHEFSGGQRQRIALARALSTDPELIIADEPVSSLDVSIQAQILNLFIEMQKKRKLSYIFIAHDLSVVHHVSNRIAVMYGGNIVEIGNASDVYNKPLHPYTKDLIASMPELKLKDKSSDLKVTNNNLIHRNLYFDISDSDKKSVIPACPESLLNCTKEGKDSGQAGMTILEGSRHVDSNLNTAEKSCIYYNKCKFAKEICLNESPELTDKNGNSHQSACHFY